MKVHRRSRRQVLRQLAGFSMGLPLAPWADFAALAQKSRPADKQHKDSTPPPAAFSPEDEQFLDELERSNFLFSGSRPVRRPA